MIKIKVYTKEDEKYYSNGIELRHLRPRRYMCGYSFDEIMKYVKEELYWEDIKEENVVEFEIYNKEEHWIQPIKRK